MTLAQRALRRLGGRRSRVRPVAVRRALVRIVIAWLATGCATAVPDGQPTADVITWRVASYNIHHARGMDDRVDVTRIAAVIRRMSPDVVALQEVDNGVARSGGEDQAARLGEILGMYHAFGSFMDYQGGRYGMAILSRCPIRSAEPVRLVDGNEPRIALAVTIAQPDSSVLTVVNVHFDWVGDDGFRFQQAREVAEYLDGIDGPWILAGDFNDQPGSRTLELFQARAREAAKPRGKRFTFSSTEPVREIDFVFAAPAAVWSVGTVEVVDEPMASDHRPVIAELSTVASPMTTSHNRSGAAWDCSGT
ncbi:MAG TPA: endonuclease/exonuclease/phosphatase family protein [Longimicrobiales bacterium]|nr:endonuclease/exonuclease/phosphatase family protein [Longimicrobiales bacterium]